MATYGVGSYAEPIVVSDEEDAAFVERELGLFTDSSSSSSQDSPLYGDHASYTPSISYFPVKAPTPVPVTAEPATPVSPLLGQKRKWAEMRDLSKVAQPHRLPENPTGKQKKKQRKEKQAIQRERVQPSSSTVSSNKQPHGNTGVHAPYLSHPDDFSAMASSVHLPYDAYYMPMDPYQLMTGLPVSPNDEYRPTDGPLWNAADRQSSLPLQATPWFPTYASPMQPAAEPLVYPPPFPRPASPHLTAGTSSPDVSAASFVTHLERRSGAPSPPSVEGTYNLGEQLRQLEALSASLLALTKGSPSNYVSTPGHSVSSDTRHAHGGAPASHPQVPKGRFELPVKPLAQPLEKQKRLIGIPDDKVKHGHYDLTQSHLDPPPPLRVAPPIPANTLVLGQIPKKFRTQNFVRGWAKRFGNALRISVDARAGKALVEWGTPALAEAAFTSMRLRGEGKEHIRAYRYIGTKKDLMAANVRGKERDREIEDGEIEEGEVIETMVAATAMAMAEKKKKKNKGKNKVQLEQRLTEPTTPARAPVPVSAPPPPPEALPPTQTHEPPPHHPPAPSSVSSHMAGPDIEAIMAFTTALRPALERLSTNPPAPAALTEVEEEMELDSDDEGRRASPELIVSAASAADDRQEDVASVEVGNEADAEEDMDMGEEDVEEDGDVNMDMEMSSPVKEPPALPVSATTRSSPPRPSPNTEEVPAPIHPPAPSPSTFTPTSPSPAPPTPASAPAVEDEAVRAAQVARGSRRKLEKDLAQAKAELTLREHALSSRPSLVSSSGSSESPEPSTPVDPPHVSGVEVTIASASGSDSDLSLGSGAADVVVKTESAAVSLDELAASFIAESIQNVSALSSASTAAPHPSAASSTTMLASVQLPSRIPLSRRNAIPIVAPVPIPKPATKQMPATSSLVPLTEAQKEAKQSQYYRLVAHSSDLMKQIMKTKDQSEKSSLMKRLRVTTNAAEELKREFTSGFAAPESISTSVMSSMPTTSSVTPTPVPHSQTPSTTPTPIATPMPIPNPASLVPQKRRSPPLGSSAVAPFRWPETAREMVIFVSDDETD
ncbi:hypothetical protein DICSQDRAFT_148537 [Dichomitus squalens LYAD-421 SS1]|uniref:Uncharacterized protein n=1 Tax=Dichomitus squalens (strain LYAD-421) TaxID=732165 RepID=R7SU83_DICSQ|nr:uncharacterized protein DICSQDRAFT_148537 [Dichomitus squalens LYAD-421 SS1]EJF59305.1 hypothetical protein DICSQDRAFT_148537 [Dichomitus squalens LYAD-421 SS1]